MQYRINNNDKISDEKISEIKSTKKISSNNQNNKNNYYTSSVQIGNVILSSADQDWIRNNVILLKQVYPLCYHNVSMQFLAGPEFRNTKFKSKKIQGMLDWLNKTREEAAKKNMTIYERLKTAVDVPPEVRKVPDGCDSWLNTNYKLNNGSQFLFYSGLSNEKYRKFDGIDISESINGIRQNDFAVASNLPNDEISVENLLKYVYSKVVSNAQGFTVSFPEMTNISSFIDNYGRVCETANSRKPHDIPIILYGFTAQDYWPTCIVMNARHHHYTLFYVIYNEDNSIKYLIYLDGNEKHSGKGDYSVEILTVDEAIKKMQDNLFALGPDGKHQKDVNVGSLFIRYSNADTVKQYYTTKN